MGARKLQDLIVWQLGSRLRTRIVRLTVGQCWARDCRFRDQVRDSAAAVPANIAEGFGRFSHGDFARFVAFARASLLETLTHIDDAEARGYWDSVTCRDLRELVNETLNRTGALLKYLTTSSTPGKKSVGPGARRRAPRT